MFPSRYGRSSGKPNEPFGRIAKASLAVSAVICQEMVHYPVTGSDEPEAFCPSMLMAVLTTIVNWFTAIGADHVIAVEARNFPSRSVVAGDVALVAFVADGFDRSHRETPVLHLRAGTDKMELRYVLVAGTTPTEVASIYSRHGSQFQKWWKHIPGRSEPLLCINEEFDNWACLIYVREVMPEFHKLRLALLTSMGGQSTLCCGVHNCPLIIQRFAARNVDNQPTPAQSTVTIHVCSDHHSVGCRRPGSLICPYTNCGIAVCEPCTKLALKDSSANGRDVVTITPGTYLSTDSDASTSEADTGSDVDSETGSDGSNHGSNISSRDTGFRISRVSEEHLIGLPCGRSNPPGLHQGMHDDLSDNEDQDNCIPGTMIDTDKNPWDVDLGPNMARVGLRSILNTSGRMLIRRLCEIRPSRQEQQFTQKIVVAFPGVSVPLIYPAAMMFPCVYPFDNQFDGSIIGCIPMPLLSTGVHCSQYNVESVAEHATMQLLFPCSTASIGSNYNCFLYDAVCNSMLQTMDTRLIKNRGIFACKTAGTLRAQTVAERMFTQCMGNREMVNRLCASQRYNPDNLFLTITPNQLLTPGLRPISEWIRSAEILERYAFYEPTAVDEIRKAYVDRSAGVLCRNWARVREQLIKYIAFSTEMPLGKVITFFSRDEYQGEQGNLAHLHALFQTDHDIDDPTSQSAFLNLMRGTIISLYDHDDVQIMMERGVFEHATDWCRMQKLARRVLTHRSDSLRHQRRNGVKKDDVVSRLPDSQHWQQSATSHVCVTVQPNHSARSWQILCHLGLAQNNGPSYEPRYEVTEPLLISKRHYAPRNASEHNMSPVNPLLFGLLKGMQNIQHVGGRSVSAYVCGYVANEDDNVKIYLTAKNQQIPRVEVKTSFQYNNKLTSSRHCNERIEHGQKNKASGRSVARHQAYSQLLGIAEVLTNKCAVIVPTSYYELRSGVEQTESIYKLHNQSGQKNLPWYQTNIDRDKIQFVIYPDADRFAMCLPQWRLFTLQQVLTIESTMIARVSIDRVSMFSGRPPELHWVKNIGNYFRWFDVAKKAFTPIEHRGKTGQISVQCDS